MLDAEFTNAPIHQVTRRRYFTMVWSFVNAPGDVVRYRDGLITI